MFVDEIRIYARAGHGGKGCVAFQREKYRPKGGPSGGNGGRGGDVILQADHDLNNLIAQYYQPRLIAEDGQGGLGKGMDGRAGKDLLVKVPCGTLVWSAGSEAQDPGAIPDVPDSPRGPLLSSIRHRPVIRSASGGQAVEVDLSEDAPAAKGSLPSTQEGQRVADLTQHRQRFVLCKGGRGG